jgi:hypothetical protein
MTDEFMRDARRFRLVRVADGSGGSETGVVAVGVEFPSGAVCMEWLDDEYPDVATGANGLSVKPGPDGVDDTRAVHGHGGRARVEWVDPSRTVQEGDAVECPYCGGEVPLAEWTVYRHGGGSCPLCGVCHLPDAIRRSQADDPMADRDTERGW